MDDRWDAWGSELERLTPFAEEWREGRTEDFIRGILNAAAKKREQRNAILALAAEIRALHEQYRELLAFFDLQRKTESWSPSACDTTNVDRVLAAMAEWRGHLNAYGPKFPPGREKTSTLAALESCTREAQAAAAAIEPCLAVLDEALGAPQPERALPVAAAASEQPQL